MPATAPIPSAFASGRYVVQRLIGEGSEKRVFLARDSVLDRPVAIALIKTQGLDDVGIVRVHRQATAMAQLGHHPHIVTIHDIGDEAGQPFLVLEFMGGGDLENLLLRSTRHRLPLAEAVRVADQMCQALDYAHRRQVVHRDLKPGNIWLTEEGGAKLGDFGLAVALDRSRLTSAGMIVGTVAYMAPEQALGREPDTRSDLYSLGAVLYEMTTARPPFLGDDALAVVTQHINTPPVAPSWHNHDVPRALEALILRLLAKAPEDRPPSAAAVREELACAMTTPSTLAEPVVSYAANPLDRLAAGIFVGREAEKNALRAAFEQVLSGRGQLLQLTGEPGIGKTRITEELATYARLRKAQVLWGCCYEGEGAPTYWPWVQIIRAYVHDRDPKELLSEMGPGAADIAQLDSAVRERLPDLPAPSPLASEQARFRLFDSITTFLRNVSTRQPLVLVLDDLHWADRPSLLLLEFLARELERSRLLVVATYRDVQVSRQHPLARTLGELARVQPSRRIVLRGLTERDVARFIELTVGYTPPAGLVAAVYRETEGNPFFINEVVLLLAADGRLQRDVKGQSWSLAVPQSIREVIGQRLDHLSDECNRVLKIATVVGREFTIEVLERVGDVGGERLLEALEEAVGARVLAEVHDGPGRYSFAHVLIRETLYEELGTLRRVRLHRRIGETLEALYASKLAPHLAELAYHFFAAADADKAIGYSRGAAEYAVARLAYEEGVRLYEMALQGFEQKEPPDEAQRCEILLALGDAHTKGGDREKAREAFGRAADLARKLGSADLLARAALGFAWWRIFGQQDDTEVRLLEEARAALGQEDSALRARVLARLAVALYAASGPEQRARLSQAAVEMARRVGDSATLAYALNCRLWAFWGPESAEERLDAATEILQLAESARDPELALESRQWRLSSLLELGDIPKVDDEMLAHARLAVELRQPLYLWMSAAWKVMRALLDGRFEEAERLAGEALTIGQRVKTGNPPEAWGGQITIVRREQGRVDEIVPWVRQVIEDNPSFHAARCGVAGFYAELGREADAREQFEYVAAHDFTDLPRDVYWLVSLVYLAETCAFLKDAGRAGMLYELLLPYGARNVVIGPGLACLGSASRYLGLLAATMSRWEDAEAHFQAALALNAKMGAEPWVAHTQYHYAAMSIRRAAQGDRHLAIALLNSALETAQKLGMKALVERAAALKLEIQGVPGRLTGSSIDAVATLVQSERPDLRAHAAPDGTVTIMFTDIENSTALTDQLGDRDAHEIIRAHNQMLRDCITAGGGVETKSQGDGFMIVFARPRGALRCAVTIQQTIAAWSARHPKVPIKVRIGIHTGPAIRDADDFFGKAVILAARIASKASGGQILVSTEVREAALGRAEFRFDRGRNVELKGLGGTYMVYELAW